MEIDDNPFTYLVFHSNGSSMIFNDFLADGKSEPGAGMLCGEKGIENIPKQIRFAKNFFQ